MTLDIVTPRGVFLHVDELDEIVVRRREREQTLGSEIAILRNHAPLLVSTCECDVRYRSGAKTSQVHAAAGTLEVRDGHLTLLTRSAERLSSTR